VTTPVRRAGTGRRMVDTVYDIKPTPPHPRVLGWFGTTALAMGGSN
jgi:hypothetical protein